MLFIFVLVLLYKYFDMSVTDESLCRRNAHLAYSIIILVPLITIVSFFTWTQCIGQLFPCATLVAFSNTRSLFPCATLVAFSNTRGVWQEEHLGNVITHQSMTKTQHQEGQNNAFFDLKIYNWRKVWLRFTSNTASIITQTSFVKHDYIYELT